MNKTVVVTKVKDNTYIVSDGEELRCDLTYSEVLSICIWFYKIDLKTIRTANQKMNMRGHDMMLFFSKNTYDTDKVDYEKMKEE